LPFDFFSASALAPAKSAGDIPIIDSIFRLFTFMRSPPRPPSPTPSFIVPQAPQLQSTIRSGSSSWTRRFWPG